MPPSSEPTWLGAHLFFRGGIYTPECDRVVLDVVEPFVRRCQREGWTDGWFFIRYSEFGPHVRLRLHGARDTLDGTVWPALEAHLRAAAPALVVGLPDAAPEWRPQTESHGDGQVTHLARVEYEPETDRYGGPHGVPLAERCFQVSSEATLALLARIPAERSSRLGKALLAMVVMVHVFRSARGDGGEFAHQYGINYLRALVRNEDGRGAWLGAFDSGFEQQAETLVTYVDEVWARMDEGDALSDALDRWHDGLRGVRDEFRRLGDAGLLTRGEYVFPGWNAAVAGIVPSYVHMMNNRLGVSIQEEAYLAYLIARALGRPGEVAAGV